jgi:hypothetical protein
MKEDCPAASQTRYSFRAVKRPGASNAQPKIAIMAKSTITHPKKELLAPFKLQKIARHLLYIICEYMQFLGVVNVR